MRSSSQFRQIRAFGSSWSFQSACVVLQIKLVLRWPWWLTVFGGFFPRFSGACRMAELSFYMPDLEEARPCNDKSETHGRVLKRIGLMHPRNPVFPAPSPHPPESAPLFARNVWSSGTSSIATFWVA